MSRTEVRRAMVERRKIVETAEASGAVALATLIRIEGSSYRRTGARLLIGSDGQYVGSVSGGCLEAEIVRKGPWLTRTGAVVQQYSTLFDDTAEIPYGLGCGGTVDVLIEPAGTPEYAALLQAMRDSLHGAERCVTTFLPHDDVALARKVVDAQGAVLWRSEHASRYENTPRFTEYLQAPPRLFLFGAGDDAQPMVRFAALLGWRVFVFDGRPQWTRVERFLQADGVYAASEFADLRPTAEDAVILMTHSYEQDRAWLTQVLPCAPRYLGLLGSRHRSALLVSEAATLLGWELARACEGMFSPVGFDLGGDGPEAIALAAIAEIQACLQGKLGQSRRMTPDSIAEQIARGGASRYLQAQCAV